MLFLVSPVFWYSLVLWPSRGVAEDNSQDVCQGVIDVLSSGLETDVNMTEINENFICLLYPTNLLNCSWSFLAAEKDTRLSVAISVCDNDTVAHPPSHSYVERVGSWALTLQQHSDLRVMIQFNMSLDDKWKVYSYIYDNDMLEFLSPPSNISAVVKNGGLMVKWALPLPYSHSHPECFEYQLDLGNQKALKNLSAQLSYTEPSADPTHTYRVRIRMRKATGCLGSVQWSEWSPTVTVGQPLGLSIPLIVTISFGIPMILLAVLLLLRHQRISTLLFPSIPRPPPKYMYFLEKNDPFSFFHPALSYKTDEEITEEEITKVEVTEENPTF